MKLFATPNIYYFCYASQKVTGGNKKAYHHVDRLRQAGFSAYIVHPVDTGFRLTWFENDTPVVGWAEFHDRLDPDRDWVVYPEDLGGQILKLAGNQKVVFNQNLYYGFHRLERPTPDEPEKGQLDPYLDPSVKAAIVVSDHNRTLLQYAYPHLPIHGLRLHIDADTFAFQPLARKRKLIAFDRKNKPETHTVYHTLRARAIEGLNALDGFEYVWLKNFSETQVRAYLRDALAFVFLSYHEGFGMMPLEAIASGCATIAFDRDPMREYLPPEYRVAQGDVLEVVQRIEAIAAAYPDRLDPWQAQADRFRPIVDRYTAKGETETLLAAWDAILSGKPPV